MPAPISPTSIPRKGALAWLDTWAMTSGVRDKELAESWVNFVLQKKIGRRAVRAHRLRQHGRAVRQRRRRTTSWSGSRIVEDPTKRADLWNEIKATP